MRIGIAVAVLVLLAGSPALGSPEAHGNANAEIIVTDHAPGSEGRGGGPGSNGSTTDQRVYSYWAIVYTRDGFCRERRVTTDQEEARAFDYVYRRRSAEANELANLGVCPADPDVERGPTPGELARDFWDVRLLPRPQPTVVPDYAVVGKRVFLHIGGAPRTTFDVPNPVGADVHIAATSRYVVDWGDGTTTTTTSQGGPWPHGDVTHVYDTARTRVTIRVTQVWSARWTAPGTNGGSLDDLRTGGDVTIAVVQVQPVRNR